MRVESSVTSISWIPSEAVSAMSLKMPFEMGIAHYDEPPPEQLEEGDLLRLRDADRFRFGNHLAAWIDVEDGRITGYGYGDAAGGLLGSTTLRLGKRSSTFEPMALDDIRRDPEISDESVTFTLTAGGRTGVPAPRRVKHKPFVQILAPLAWSTLRLTIYADGRSEGVLAGASPFPRHWVYDDAGKLAAKSGTIDFREWYRTAFGEHSPWGDQDSLALATAVETALERRLSSQIMRGGAKPKIRKIGVGALLTEQGQEGAELYVLLDGVLGVEVDGESIAELGPGAVLGERALLEGGTRTATLRAVTKVKVAVATADEIEPSALGELRTGHRREEQR